MLNCLFELLPKRQGPKWKPLGATIELWVHNRSCAIKPHLANSLVEIFEDPLWWNSSGEENFWGCERYVGAEPLPSLVETEGTGLKGKGMLDEFFDEGCWSWESRSNGIWDLEDLSFFLVDYVGEFVRKSFPSLDPSRMVKLDVGSEVNGTHGEENIVNG
jgi:hypothetical protein